MVDTKKERIRRWLLAVGWTFLIYSTLYYMRLVSDFLKQHLPYTFFINVFMLISSLAILFYILRIVKIKRPSSYFLLGGIMCIYVMAAAMITYPDEKMHFIQYGVLSFLIFRALDYDCPAIVSYAGSFFLTTLIGWGDELIQDILPNRYYSFNDVLLNSFSGMLSLLITFVIMRENGPSNIYKIPVESE